MIAEARAATARDLRIGGLEKLSVVDWPGQLCAVVFCQGCAWRCPYCHNPHLIPFAPTSAIAWDDVRAWLQRRCGLLDGVVFSGGEPTLQPGLAAAVREVRELGFKVGLHTGGVAPERLADLLPSLDWVGFDVKAPFGNYASITGHAHGERARASLHLIRAAGVPFEVRTTWHPALLSPANLIELAHDLIAVGCPDWIIQRFRPDGCDDSRLGGVPVGAPPLDCLRTFPLRIFVR